jgi:hypothetical protein
MSFHVRSKDREITDFDKLKEVLKKPLSLISMVLGALTLGALVLFSSGLIASGSLTINDAY